MSRLASAASLALALLLSACASVPQAPVAMKAGVLTPDGKVGVIMSAIPKVDTEFPGAGCLLCIATASAMNSKLTDHARTLGAEDLPMLKRQAAEAIVKRGGGAVALEGEIKPADLPKMSGDAPNTARQDFRSLAATYKVDRLLVVELSRLGFDRAYAAYVPTEAPKAVVRGVAYLVNLKTNEYDWYAPINVTQGATNWDQPPSYPELTNAYYQAVELAKDAVLKPLR